MKLHGNFIYYSASANLETGVIKMCFQKFGNSKVFKENFYNKSKCSVRIQTQYFENKAGKPSGPKDTIDFRSCIEI